MRIAHCIHGLGLGGAQKVLETLVSSLKAPAYQHFVYCSLDGPVRAGIEKAGGVVTVLPRTLPKLDPLWAFQLAKAMRTDRVDLVHTHLFGDSLHGLLAGRSARIPVMMTLHNNQARFNWLQRFGYSKLLPRCAAVIACAPSVKRSFTRVQPSLEDTIEVIPNGIAPDEGFQMAPADESRLRTELGLESESLVLVAMGRFVEQKGYEYLIDAFSRLPRNLRTRTQLLLLGHGPLEGRLRRLAESLNLTRQVLFPGFRQDVRAIVGIADVVVFSSLWEGLPIALLEAMAAQRAIVATDIEAFRDAVQDGSEAVLVRPADPRSLAKGLENILIDKSTREAFGLRAQDRFSTEFTASKMVNRYSRVYADIVAQ